MKMYVDTTFLRRPTPKSTLSLWNTLTLSSKLNRKGATGPNGVGPPEDSQLFWNDYLNHEGTALALDGIAKNPGGYSLAKIKLNNFWGKFVQRTNTSSTASFKEPEPSHSFKTTIDFAQDVDNLSMVHNKLVLLMYHNKRITPYLRQR